MQIESTLTLMFSMGNAVSETCLYCDSEITIGGLMKAANPRFSKRVVDIVNFIHGTDYAGLCEKCGLALWNETNAKLQSEIIEKQTFLENHISDFPMMTIGTLPSSAAFKVKSMVTANVTVGTGIFNEFSQGLSDIFGTVSSTSGMAHKVNGGEAAARAILVQKAIAMGANAIIGVDIDYGITANNAATVNMQGTAVAIDDLGSVIHRVETQKATDLQAAISRVAELKRWIRADFSKGQSHESG